MFLMKRSLNAISSFKSWVPDFRQFKRCVKRLDFNIKALNSKSSKLCFRILFKVNSTKLSVKVRILNQKSHFFHKFEIFTKIYAKKNGFSSFKKILKVFIVFKNFFKNFFSKNNQKINFKTSIFHNHHFRTSST